MEGKIIVTNQMEFTIIKLHQEGLEYVKIDQALGLKRDQVRYVCKKYETSTEKIDAKKDIPGRCANCGAAFPLEKYSPSKRFCGEKCRREWGDAHPKMYAHTCEYCGGTFESRNTKTRYCSRECYSRTRFYREEDIEELKQKLFVCEEHITPGVLRSL